MAKITYTNKVALNVNPEIADINKVKDSDMNEIKSVVNTNADNLGDLTILTTTAKNSTVAAINELNSNKASTNEVLIQNTEPTAADNKIWIDTGEIASPVSEITNEYSTSTGIGYSANYVNTKLPKIVYTTTDVSLSLATGASGYVAITKPSVTGYACIGCTFKRTGGNIVLVSSPILDDGTSTWRTRITNISNSNPNSVTGVLYVYWATNTSLYS